MGKKEDLSDFERGMVVGARWAGLSISKNADLLGFWDQRKRLCVQFPGNTHTKKM